MRTGEPEACETKAHFKEDFWSKMNMKIGMKIESSPRAHHFHWLKGYLTLPSFSLFAALSSSFCSRNALAVVSSSYLVSRNSLMPSFPIDPLFQLFFPL